MARMGRGLPPDVLPMALHAAGMPGHDVFAAALAAGGDEDAALVAGAALACLVTLTAAPFRGETLIVAWQWLPSIGLDLACRHVDAFNAVSVKQIACRIAPHVVHDPATIGRPNAYVRQDMAV